MFRPGPHHGLQKLQSDHNPQRLSNMVRESSDLLNKHSGRRGRLIGILGYILAVLGRRTGPRGEKMAGGSWGTDFQDLATILDPFWAIFVDLGPDRLSAT